MAPQQGHLIIQLTFTHTQLLPTTTSFSHPYVTLALNPVARGMVDGPLKDTLIRYSIPTLTMPPPREHHGINIGTADSDLDFYHRHLRRHRRRRRRRHFDASAGDTFVDVTDANTHDTSAMADIDVRVLPPSTRRQSRQRRSRLR